MLDYSGAQNAPPGLPATGQASASLLRAQLLRVKNELVSTTPTEPVVISPPASEVDSSPASPAPLLEPRSPSPPPNGHAPFALPTQAGPGHPVTSPPPLLGHQFILPTQGEGGLHLHDLQHPRQVSHHASPSSAPYVLPPAPSMPMSLQRPLDQPLSHPGHIVCVPSSDDSAGNLSGSCPENSVSVLGGKYVVSSEATEGNTLKCVEIATGQECVVKVSIH